MEIETTNYFAESNLCTRPVDPSGLGISRKQGIFEMIANRKVVRGPLKAVYQPIPAPNDAEISKSLCSIDTASGDDPTTDEQQFKENLPHLHTYWTDSEDAFSVTSSTTNPSSLESIDFSPVLRRSSTQRISRLLSSQRPETDIRSHFPVACRGAMQVKTVSSIPPHQFHPTGERKRVATTAADAVSGRLSALHDDSLSCACCTTPKRPRTAELPPTQPRGCGVTSSAHAFPSLVVMGAGVRSHPLYACKRRLSVETESEKDYANSLAPVCPVPMPPAFPAGALGNGTTRAWPPAQRTAQTQTSPSPPPRKSHCRRSSGAKVLSSIKKSIGSIRRAVSADRQDKSLVSSFSSASTRSWKRRSSESTLCSPKVTKNTDRNEVSVSQDAVNCIQLKTFSDKSYLVQLKRTSTAIQFGFFIAKDAHGLYVSRINSPDYFARMSNFIHVSDRILEVQGISAAGLDIATVSGLLRGCHIATFRVKPNRPTVSTRSRSPFRHR